MSPPASSGSAHPLLLGLSPHHDLYSPTVGFVCVCVCLCVNVCVCVCERERDRERATWREREEVIDVAARFLRVCPPSTNLSSWISGMTPLLSGLRPLISRLLVLNLLLDLPSFASVCAVFLLRVDAQARKTLSFSSAPPHSLSVIFILVAFDRMNPDPYIVRWGYEDTVSTKTQCLLLLP